MTASVRRKLLLRLAGCVAGLLLVGGLIAVLQRPMDGPPSLRTFRLKSRVAEDAIIPVAKDLDRHAEFLARAKQGRAGVLFLGDSITNRWLQAGEASWIKLAVYNPANFGVEGDCTENLLWRIEHGELDAIAPSVVVLLIGTNNIFYFADEKPEWTARGVEKIVRVIKKRSPASKVLLFGIFPRDEKTSRVRQTITAVNQAIQTLDDEADVRFVDISDQFLDGDGNIPIEIMPDKVHLSAKGYEIWYRSLEPLLSEMMR